MKIIIIGIMILSLCQTVASAWSCINDGQGKCNVIQGK